MEKKDGFTRLNDVNGGFKANQEFEITNEKHIVKCLNYLKDLDKYLQNDLFDNKDE